MKSLLLEIGTEEIPPSFVAPAARELERRIRTLLAGHEVKAGSAELFYTPRRIAVRFAEVAPERPARTSEIQGPPAKVAFGPDGKPTKTALGFARAQGRTEKDLLTRSTPKGEYVFVLREEPALPTAALLADSLPGIIAGLPFARIMRWREDKTRFARPIRWLLCIFGEEPLRFELAGLQSADLTRGHRGTGAPVRVPGAADYERILGEQSVLCRPSDRRAAALKAIEELCAGAGGNPVLDPELVEETVNITEYPVPILCRFDPAHLTLPAEVLITALKKHQRCFAVRAGAGQEPGPHPQIAQIGAEEESNPQITQITQIESEEESAKSADEKSGGFLLPLFVAVADTPGCDRKLVGRWYEHAVESRLRDARFYFEQDMAKGLNQMADELRFVTWIDELGSYDDKSTRLQLLAHFLAPEGSGVDTATLQRAAKLAKADLVSAMVREKEFTSLQGVMGGIYARMQGEKPYVATAIAEHYKPVSSEDSPPSTVYGALLSIADKLDNVVAAYALGVDPTGSEDPYGIRRQAYGIISMMLHYQFAELDLDHLVRELRTMYSSQYGGPARGAVELLKGRLGVVLADRGLPYDIINAVQELYWNRPVHAQKAAEALLEFRKRPEFERLIIGQKRVANILKDQEVAGQPDPGAFVEEAEKQLWAEAGKVEPGINRAMERFDFVPALELLLTLRQPIDLLFDEVMVMAEDEKLRLNRLRLMLYVRSLFRRVADLSRIVIEGETQRPK